MPPYFQPKSETIKPYALMDLDDTLFQTQRKLDLRGGLPAASDPLTCVSVNKQGKPLGWLTKRQSAMLNWLLASTELIAVTARDTKEIDRVKVAFASWQVLTHGGVIIQPNGVTHPYWQSQMLKQLAPLQPRLNQLIEFIEDLITEHHQHFRLTVHSDCFASADSVSKRILTIYLAIKHSQRDHQALANLATTILNRYPTLDDHFYIHINANNLAILPHAVHKRHAVKFLLSSCLDPDRPSFGFGDSLTDLPFLQLLDWYGTPNHGQLHDLFLGSATNLT